MTEKDDQTLRPYSTDKLLVNFTQSRFSLYLVAAVVIHVVFIAITSVGYINERWIDPEGAARRKAGLEAAQSNKMASAAAVPAANTGSVSNMAPAVAPASAAPADRTNTAIMKQITDTAKPSEIPNAPDDLGISIKDTNPQ